MSNRQSARMILAQSMMKRALYPHSRTSPAVLWAGVSRHKEIRDLWLGAADEALAALGQQGYTVTDGRVGADDRTDQ